MFKKITNLLLSMQFMTLLLLLFAAVIGYATFIENDFGRSAAKALIFNKWWFELILLLLIVNLTANLFRFKLFRKEKLAALSFHLSFIVILIGSAITRYVSYEGMMHIREGESSDSFISDDTFLKVHVNNYNPKTKAPAQQLNYEKKLFLSPITKNNFSFTLNFLNDIKVSYQDFLVDVKDSLIINPEINNKLIHLVVPGDNGMQSEFLKDKEQKLIKDEIFTFNNPVAGAINIKDSSGVLVCNSPYDLEKMSMLTREKNKINKLVDFSFNPKALHTTNGLNFVLKEYVENGMLKKVNGSKKMKDGSDDMLIVKVESNGKEKIVQLSGGKGFEGKKEEFTIDGINFSLSYGSKYYKTPFSLYLRDFQLERYPGSQSPSSYAAEVTILDKKKKYDQDFKNISKENIDELVKNNQYTETDYRIYMNNVLQHKGFRFFQSSYDKDEKGTILSVNHDWWGTIITYVGYFLLSLGFVLVLFAKKSRFSLLRKKLQKLNIKNPLIFILLFTCFKVDAHQPVALDHANKFQQLVIQDNGGRLKPVNTLCSEYLRKITGKDKYNTLTSTQTILGMMSSPKHWSNVNLIKVSSKKLRTLLEAPDLNSRSTLLKITDFFNSDGDYLILNDVESAYSMPVEDRSQFEKDIIRVDERINICFMIFNGGIFRFFPVPDDENNTWVSSLQSNLFSGKDSLFVATIMPLYFNTLKESLETNQWNYTDTIVQFINKFQERYGAEVLPSKAKVDLEVIYNQSKIFSRLFIYYFTFGFLLLILSILQIFNNSNLLTKLVKLISFFILFGFIVHTGGLIVRWIISNHAPWSNGYESMIYIAWATMLSGWIFNKRSMLPLTATAIVSALILMVAHLNWLDPTITNLVPVLNSYWLMIHVSIITSSYGFFSLAFMLGFLSLCLIIFQSKENFQKVKTVLSELKIINEKTIELGLVLLTIGTFLGGVWANESWGRYWGWDPKETWALVSILIYAFILHMRFIPKLNNTLVFSSVSMFAIWTIIMTYFGVNYYLSGLHSYAAGDPMPIPKFVYYLLAIMIISTILAKLKYKKEYK